MQKALQWANTFNVSICLNSNNFSGKYAAYQMLIAIDVLDELRCPAGSAFDRLELFRAKHPDWIFGYLTYDLKNEIEDITSHNHDKLQFPDLYFFAPKHLIILKNNQIEIVSADRSNILRQIDQQVILQNNYDINIDIKPRFSRDEYLQNVQAIQQHIIRGDIYEASFCQEFYAENALIDPLRIYIELNNLSPAPYSCYFKINNKYILSSSPERFLAKQDNRLISQPIKGTARRSANKAEDEVLKETLKKHPKEQQENVMIVDLVRNDLTRSAVPGSVYVEELFGIHSFKQVHQMVSTIVCDKQQNINDIQSIKNTFPMGSMTGAPKLSAMQLIEKYERTKRGVYSGAIGYFDAAGNFDFNVVIRTVLYNSENNYLSFHVGSAITHNAIAENEYDECLLKAKAILEVLGRR